VVYPLDQTALFGLEEFGRRLAAKSIKLHLQSFIERKGVGMLHSEVMFCRADCFTPATYIIHVDSDCIFSDSVGFEHYFGLTAHGQPSDRPRLHYRSWDRVRSPDHYTWKEVVELTLKETCMKDLMCMHPIILHRETYGLTRRLVEAANEIPFDDFVLSRRVQPLGFAEINTLGWVAYSRQPYLYNLHNLDLLSWPYGSNPLRQFWSHHRGPDGMSIDQARLKELREALGKEWWT
jgi:hypothetical protein